MYSTLVAPETPVGTSMQVMSIQIRWPGLEHVGRGADLDVVFIDLAGDQRTAEPHGSGDARAVPVWTLFHPRHRWEALSQPRLNLPFRQILRNIFFAGLGAHDRMVGTHILEDTTIQLVSSWSMAAYSLRLLGPATDHVHRAGDPSCSGASGPFWSGSKGIWMKESGLSGNPS